MCTRKRVAVTGMGIISAVGNDIDTFWNNIVNGVSGIKRIDSDIKTLKLAATVPDFKSVNTDKSDLASQYVQAARLQALNDAGLSKTELDSAYCKLAVNTADSSSFIGDAFNAVRNSDVTIAIAGGSQVFSSSSLVSQESLCTSDDPDRAMQPFNSNRSGYVPGDGAAVLILEEFSHAKARGAEIYAEIVGFASSKNDGFERNDGIQQAKAISKALQDARFNPLNDTLFINANANATHLFDTSETNALKIALGSFAYRAQISSVKSMTGHMLGASGAVEAIASILAIREGIAPPTIHLDCPDPECDLNYTPNKAVKRRMNIAISNYFDALGVNNCLAIRKIG